MNNKGVLFCFTDFKAINIENGYSAIYNEYSDIIRGIAWGKEICPTTGSEHNQGYVQMYKQARWTAIQKMFNSKCHFEVCRGSVKDNDTYCSKENVYTKLGDFVSRGYRSDLHNIKDDLKEGKGLYDIMENYTGDFLRYHSGIGKMKELIDKKKRQEIGYKQPEVTVLYGKAGEGKTNYIYSKYGYENVFKISRYDDPKFMFNGYENERVLVLDDFYGGIQYSYLLQLLDGYPLDLNVKNGVRYNYFDKVYITSNDLPYKWYSKGIQDNLKRRIKSCLEVSEGNTNDLTPEYCYSKDRKQFYIDIDSNSDSDTDDY